MTIELLLVSTTPGLAEALHGYEGLQVSSLPSLARVKSIVMSDQPPQAIYVEDTRGMLNELWDVIRAAQSKQLLVLVGLQSVGMVHRGDFVDAGLPICDARDVAALATWIGAQLGVRKLAAASQIMIAIAGAKGGIGKTLVVAMLAEGLKRRGLQVLVVDGDISNSGLVPTFRIPSGFPSYLYLKSDGLGAFTPTNVRRHIFTHAASGIHFLLGSEETANSLDFTLGEWQALLQAVRALDGYDVVLIDTGPEIKKRPYAIDAARTGGYVVLPTPPGRKERAGVGNALRMFEQHTPDLTDRCLLLYMAPEKGGTVSVNQIASLFAEIWPRAKALGVLPRAPRQVSMADEEGDHYLSPLDVAPHSRFTRAVQHIVQALCDQTGLKPALPMPQSSLWQQRRGEKIALVPTALPAVGRIVMRPHLVSRCAYDAATAYYPASNGAAACGGRRRAGGPAGHTARRAGARGRAEGTSRPPGRPRCAADRLCRRGPQAVPRPLCAGDRAQRRGCVRPARGDRRASGAQWGAESRAGRR